MTFSVGDRQVAAQSELSRNSNIALVGVKYNYPMDSCTACAWAIGAEIRPGKMLHRYDDDDDDDDDFVTLTTLDILMPNLLSCLTATANLA